ncbi:MAG: sigma-70 family RNA polymerase sigma factor [Planctomycetota bacterium]
MNESQAESLQISMFQALAANDPQAVEEFWQQYAGPLRRVAQRQISRSLGRRVDADDVLQSACRTFFRRMGEGQFQCRCDDDLWRLLLTITLNKVRMQARYHARQCRGLEKEQTFDVETAGAHEAGTEQAVQQVDFADYMESIFRHFDEEAREVFGRMLDGQTQTQIATNMEISERTVRRIRVRIQERLQVLLAEDSDR